MSAKSYVFRKKSEVTPTPCPCGSATRIITREDTDLAGFHITHIQDAKRHYHKHTTEMYHILEGTGTMEVDEDAFPVEPGDTLLIPPGTPHRGYGDFTTIVIPIPAFDPDDEYVVDDE